MNRRLHARHCRGVLTLCLVLAASGPIGSCCAPSPEGQIRERIAQARKTAERKELRALDGFVSDSYTDEQGRNKQTVVQLLTQYLIRQTSIHLITRVEEIRVVDPTSAQVELLVASARTAVGGLDELPRVQADLYRFELAVSREDGVWRITSAQWRAAGLDEFLK